MLYKELKEQGNWLFRWRSYVPLVMLPLMFAALLYEREHVFFVTPEAQFIYLLCCLALSALGLLVRALVIGYVPVGTSGRNTTEQRATSLNTDGIYSVVRHPLYLGNFMILLGIALSIPVWWFGLIFGMFFFLYYERIMYAEEAYLHDLYGEDYKKWALVTPAFLPRLSGWRTPSMEFSLLNILKREYPGLFAIIVSFTVIEILRGLIGHGKLELSTGWMTFFMVGLVIYITLRTLKKTTRILHVEGR